MTIRDQMVDLVHTTQDAITAALEAIDGGDFLEDRWERDGGGGGRTRVMQNSRLFDKAGVNCSVVHGELNDDAVEAMRARHDLGSSRDFFATGVSLVLHPHNPMAPTVHANYRYFELGNGESWWFGGGCDLTPSYLFPTDATHFHQVHKNACDAHDSKFYPRFKEWCDEYFHIPHRNEGRGLGGIFFDDLNDRPAADCLAFVQQCASAFLPAYLPILRRRVDLPYTDENKRWQQLRRGRYVEFNLVYDRGTVFGLKTKARTESVLMSLPLTARWEYDHEPAPRSKEGKLVAVLRSPKAWA
jgi:coproporphyrinogen III oxidase